LAKQYFPKNEDGYRFFWFPEATATGNNPIDKAAWVLMTTNVLERSRNKRFDDQSPGQGPTQKQCIAELAEKARCDYIVPPALDAAACIFAQYFKDPGKRLFSDKPWT
jgi:hypothetical protein